MFSLLLTALIVGLGLGLLGYGVLFAFGAIIRRYGFEDNPELPYSPRRHWHPQDSGAGDYYESSAPYVIKEPRA